MKTRDIGFVPCERMLLFNRILENEMNKYEVKYKLVDNWLSSYVNPWIHYLESISKNTIFYPDYLTVDVHKFDYVNISNKIYITYPIKGCVIKDRGNQKVLEYYVNNSKLIDKIRNYFKLRKLDIEKNPIYMPNLIVYELDGKTSHDVLSNIKRDIRFLYHAFITGSKTIEKLPYTAYDIRTFNKYDYGVITFKYMFPKG